MVTFVDLLQALRMSVLWPLVVGSVAVLLARLLFFFLHNELNRDHAVACVIVGVAGGVVAWAIAVAWDDGPTFWLAFTVGLLVLAVILGMTVVQLLVEMWQR